MSNGKQAYLAGLQQDRDVAYKQLSNALDDVIRARLKRKIADLEQEIQQVESELASAAPSPPSGKGDKPDSILDEYARLQASLESEQPNPFLAKLRNIISKSFNESELRELCDEVGADYQNLGGGGKADRTRELVAWCERRSRTPDLVRIVYARRPAAGW